MMNLLVMLLLGMSIAQGVNKEILIGKWKTIKVDYLDKDPVIGMEGQNMIFEFMDNNTCKNHLHNSVTTYTIDGRVIDMGGYKIIVEKLTEQELIFREQKDFFIRRFFCERIKD